MPGDKRMVLTDLGSCNDIFYDEIRRGNIHNGQVKINKDGQVTQFRLNGVLIDENPRYDDIAMAMRELNKPIQADAGKFEHKGQQHHTLAQ